MRRLRRLQREYPGTVISQSRNTFPNFLPLNLANFSPRLAGTTYLFNLANLAVQQLGPTHPFALLVPGTLNTLPGNPLLFLTSSLFKPPRLSLSPTLVGLDLLLPQSKLKTPYALQYALTFERQLSENLTLDVAYVGTRGVKLLRVSTPDRGLNMSRVSFTGAAPLSTGRSFPVLQRRRQPAAG